MQQGIIFIGFNLNILGLHLSPAALTVRVFPRCKNLIDTDAYFA